MFRSLIYIIAIFALFSVELTYGEDHHFETTAEGIINALTNPITEQEVKTRNLKGIIQPKTRGLRIVRVQEGLIVEKTIMVSEDSSTQGVNLKIGFDFDSYDIRPGSFTLLNELGMALTSEKLREKTIDIKGHTDSDGDSTYNLKLSINRAIAVKSYLMTHFHISSSLLNTIGYGEEMPLVPNTSNQNKQINRRVEISITTGP